MVLAVFAIGVVIAATGIDRFSRPAAGAEVITGRAVVTDGDTLRVAGVTIRLEGIDAPEGGQPCHDARGGRWNCGAAATLALRRLAEEAPPLRCERRDIDRYGRTVAVCRRADGRDIAALLVAEGLALDWPRYSGGAYAGEQAAARRSGRGLWAGRFEAPWDYRAGRR